MTLLVLLEGYLLVLPFSVVLGLDKVIRVGLGSSVLGGHAAGERNLSLFVDDIGLRHLAR